MEKDSFVIPAFIFSALLVCAGIFDKLYGFSTATTFQGWAQTIAATTCLFAAVAVSTRWYLPAISNKRKLRPGGAFVLIGLIALGIWLAF
jgi:hypothetical protein